MARSFQPVEDEDEGKSTVIAHPANQEQRNLAAQTLVLLLKGLSQKAIVAISSLFSAGALLSAWWLWMTVLPDPTNNQLIGVSIYAVFLLLLEFLRRR